MKTKKKEEETNERKAAVLQLQHYRCSGHLNNPQINELSTTPDE